MSGIPDPINPHFVDAIVSSVDILGFRSILETRPAHEISRILRTLQWTAEADPNDAEPSAHVRVLSGVVIRVARRDEPGALFSEVNALRLAQMEMAAQGIFLRGGITFGEVYWDETVIFGPGVVDACELSHNFALVPRIVLGSPVVRSILNGVTDPDHDLNQELAYMRTMISRAEDAVWFIDYLRNAEREMDGPEMYSDLLKAHKGAIIDLSNLVEHTGRLTSLAMKTGWLARYHNDTVRALADSALVAMGSDRDLLSINADELPAIVDLPEPGESLRANLSDVR